MKKIFLYILIILNFTSVSLAENLKFKKITSLVKPWGSSFISNDKIIITEKTLSIILNPIVVIGVLLLLVNGLACKAPCLP